MQCGLSLIGNFQKMADEQRENEAYLTLLDCFLDFLDFDFTEAFDLEKCLAGCTMNRLRHSYFQAY